MAWCGVKTADRKVDQTAAMRGAGVSDPRTRVAQIKKVIVLMTYFLLSDH